MTVLFDSVNINFQSTVYSYKSPIGPCFADNVAAIFVHILYDTRYTDICMW